MIEYLKKVLNGRILKKKVLKHKLEVLMKIMKKQNVKASPASYVWGVKNPKKVANKYNGYGVVKGSKK